jgi:deoxyribonuclease-4
MEIGAHVSSSGGLVNALDRGSSIGADVVQIFTQSPRMWRSPSHTAEDLAAYRAAQLAHPRIRATFCHATYLVNLATGNEELFERSRHCLVENLVAASAIGASGVVLHVGSHLGAGLDAVLGQVAAAVRGVLDEAAEKLGEPACALLLENTAGAGGTVGRSFDELAAIIAAAGNGPQLGICLDTQHLFASGVEYTSVEAADRCVESLDASVGLERLGCIHLNDSKVPFGSNRDRHENLGDGEIGLAGLSCLLGHPALQNAPALLEVPGDGDGPRAEDVAGARAVLAEGLRLRSGAPRRRPRSSRSGSDVVARK